MLLNVNYALGVAMLYSWDHLHAFELVVHGLLLIPFDFVTITVADFSIGLLILYRYCEVY